MKTGIKILKVVVGLIGFLFVFCAAVMLLETWDTSYLKGNRTSLFDVSKRSYIIKNVNVIPMSQDTILPHKMVLVKDGVIIGIGNVLGADGITVLDGENGFLSPGLIDMHTHVWDTQELGLYLANGVTSIRNLWGYQMHLNLKEQLLTHEIIGPNLFVSSPKLTGLYDEGDDKIQVKDKAHMSSLIADYKQRGFDGVKLYAGLPDSLFVEALKLSKQHDFEIAIHPSREFSYFDQFEAPVKSIEHAEEIVQQPLDYQLDSIKLKAVVDKFATEQMAFSPTLIGYYNIEEFIKSDAKGVDKALTQYINPLIQKVDVSAQFERWQSEKERNSNILNTIEAQHQFHLFIVKQMHEAGVKIVCGTDAGIGVTAPGFSIHQELQLYVQAGLTPYEALKTATINPSTTHRAFSRLGEIRPNALANLVLTKGNPLQQINHLETPEWVMVDGILYSDKALSTFISEAKDRNGLFSTALRYLEYLVIERN